LSKRVLEASLATTISATSKNVEQGIETDWTLYDFICEHPNLSVYAIHKALGWSTGKVQKTVRRLEERGYVESQMEYNPGRPKRIVRPTEWKKVYKMLREEGFEE